MNWKFWWFCIGTVGFWTCSIAQVEKQNAWITFCDSQKIQPDPIYLDDVLLPLNRHGGEEKLALIIYNKSREGLPLKSIYDVLPVIDKNIFIPFVMRYNGDGRSLEFRFKESALGGNTISEVLESRAYLVCNDKEWGEFFRENKANLNLMESTDLPVEQTSPNFVVFELVRRSAVRKRKNDKGFSFESEFWYRLHKLVDAIDSESRSRKERAEEMRREEKTRFGAGGLSLLTRAPVMGWSDSEKRWGGESSSVYASSFPEAALLFSWREFSEPLRFEISRKGTSVEPQIGIAFGVQSIQIESDWDDVVGLDISEGRGETLGETEQIRLTYTNVRESLSLSRINSLSIPVGVVVRPTLNRHIAIRFLACPGFVRAQGVSNLTSGEFDYYLTSSLVPDEALTDLPSLGLTSGNKGLSYNEHRRSFSGSSWRYSADAVLLGENTTWSMGLYFSKLTFNKEEGQGELPSTEIGNFTSTWTNQEINLTEFGLSMGLGFSTGKR